MNLCGVEDCDIYNHLLDFRKIDENQDTPLCDAPDELDMRRLRANNEIIDKLKKLGVIVPYFIYFIFYLFRQIYLSFKFQLYCIHYSQKYNYVRDH